MRDCPQIRRARIFLAILLLLCFVALLIPHTASAGSLHILLFVPIFLFGLLDLCLLLQGVVRADEPVPPLAPVLTALFQRPPPSFE